VATKVTTGCFNEINNDNITFDANGCVTGHCEEIIFTDDVYTWRITDDQGVQQDSYPYELKGSTLIVYYTDDAGVEEPIKIEGNTVTITTSNPGTGCTAVTTYKKK
jgi:hypothetical protein